MNSSFRFPPVLVVVFGSVCLAFMCVHFFSLTFQHNPSFIGSTSAIRAKHQQVGPTNQHNQTNACDFHSPLEVETLDNDDTAMIVFPKTSYDSHVKNCSLTVVVLDPSLPFNKRGTQAYRMLESVADYVPHDACIVIQTSICIMEEYLRHGIDRSAIEIIESTGFKGQESMRVSPDISNFVHTVATDHKKVTPHNALQAVIRNMYDRSYAKFKRRIDSGRVRFSVLNHTKYGWNTCSNFYNPGYAWLNSQYYLDEFIHGVDNDLMLFIEKDALLCRELLVDKWKAAAGEKNEITFLGAPWGPDICGSPTVMKAWDVERGFFQVKRGHFDGNRKAAKNMTKQQLEFEHSKYNRILWLKYWQSVEENEGNASNSTFSLLLPPPPYLPFPTRHPNMDVAETKGTCCNGGLSLRSRKWLLRAIATCPTKYANLPPTTTRSSNCTYDFPSFTNDDIYFGSLLNAIGPEINMDFASYFSHECMSLSPQTDDFLMALGGNAWVQDYKIQRSKYSKNGAPFAVGFHSAPCPPKDVCKYACDYAINDEEL